ncbi:MAG: hypothetical protein OEN01_10155 [Candidatus Krumholzibacteria bacterium]|nr:hypothetical protein [Candidatus Krumholzibacteria bacterium]
MIVYNDGMMLTDAYRRNNVQLTSSFGVEYPTHFVHPVAEYLALVNDAGVIDLTHWGILRLSGRDRLSFLNAMITNDVSSLPENDGRHSLITTVKGKIISELFVFARQADVVLFVSQGNVADTHDVLQKHIISEDVIVEDLSPQFGVIAIEGPKSYDILWRVFSKGPFPKESLQAVTREFADVELFLMTNSVTGEPGYHVMIPADRVERMRNFLVQSGRGSDGLPVGSIAWNMRRVENGLPWYGVDYTQDNLPPESRLDDAISYSKGCFRGQEPLARLHHRGHVNRLLVGLTLDEDHVSGPWIKLAEQFEMGLNNYDEDVLKQKASPVAQALDLASLFAANTTLYHDEPGTDAGRNDRSQKPLGRITSAVYSPRLKKPLFLGYVRPELADKTVGVVADAGQRLSLIDLPIA